MIIDAHTFPFPIKVFHVPTSKFLHYAHWVDDELSIWRESDLPIRYVGNEIAGTTHFAKRIELLIESRLILIDPIEDTDQSELEVKILISEDAWL